jgi:hypothetical protein
VVTLGPPADLPDVARGRVYHPNVRAQVWFRFWLLSRGVRKEQLRPSFSMRRTREDKLRIWRPASLWDRPKKVGAPQWAAPKLVQDR